MCLTASRLGHEVLMWHKPHTLSSFCNLVNVDRLALYKLRELWAHLLNICSAKGHSTFQLLLHLFKIYKFTLSKLSLTRSWTFTLVSVLFSRSHAFIALKLLDRSCRTCCCGDTSTTTKATNTNKGHTTTYPKLNKVEHNKDKHSDNQPQNTHNTNSHHHTT